MHCRMRQHKAVCLYGHVIIEEEIKIQGSVLIPCQLRGANPAELLLCFQEKIKESLRGKSGSKLPYRINKPMLAFHTHGLGAIRGRKYLRLNIMMLFKGFPSISQEATGITKIGAKANVGGMDKRIAVHEQVDKKRTLPLSEQGKLGGNGLGILRSLPIPAHRT